MFPCVTPRSGPHTVLPDESMGSFGHQDPLFQLHGNVGYDCHLDGVAEQKSKAQKMALDMLSSQSSSERHKIILSQLITGFNVSAVT